MATLKELKTNLKKAKEVAKVADNARTAARRALHDYIKSCIETLVADGDLRVSSNGRDFVNDLYEVWLWSDGSVKIYDRRLSNLSYSARRDWEKQNGLKYAGGLVNMKASARREGYQAGYDFLNRLASRLQ